MDLAMPSLLGFGFIVGIKHAFEADHVAAISTIASQTNSVRRSSLIGAIWGLGHTATLLIVGVIVLAFSISVPEKAALSMEFLVGILLIILGADTVRKAIRDRTHSHEHSHDSKTHMHPHSHKISALHNHAHRSFFLGIIHGLAGSAALMLLVLSTVKSVTEGLIYILVFGFGSVIGMALAGSLLSIPLALSQRFSRMSLFIKISAGTASIFIGILLMHETVTMLA